MKNTICVAFFLAFVMIFSCESLFAKPVSCQTAREVALQKLSTFPQSPESSLAHSAEIKNDQASVLGYVFFLKPQGYIVVAADSRIRPIIAHSTTSDFGEMNAAQNPLLQILITDLENRLQSVARLAPELLLKNRQQWDQYLNPHLQKATATTFEQWPPQGTTLTGGWLKTQWSQEDPFNRDCPLDIHALEKEQQQVRSVAGCPAIALAQILNHFQTLNATRFDDQDDFVDNFYSSEGLQYRIDDDFERLNFPSFPQLNAKLDYIELRWQNRRALNAIDKAALIFACGIAAKQVYSARISGTFNVQQAYNAYLRLGFGNARLYPNSIATSVILPHLAQNMKEARPAHLAVVTPEWNAGHNLVVDGYNTNEEYHLNFGWNGSYDGWYALPDITIPGYTFNVIEGVIVDIYELPNSAVLPEPEKTPVFSLTNYPNPFNPATTIEYNLPTATQVLLQVYDLQGREVACLVDALQSAGNYRVHFHTEHLSAGIYFYRLSGDTRTVVRKMTLLK